jgi:hypothetical protein
MEFTKQGVRNLNKLGPQKPRRSLSDEERCLVGDHDVSGQRLMTTIDETKYPWVYMYKGRYCKRCGMFCSQRISARTEY